MKHSTDNLHVYSGQTSRGWPYSGPSKNLNKRPAQVLGEDLQIDLSAGDLVVHIRVSDPSNS